MADTTTTTPVSSQPGDDKTIGTLPGGAALTVITATREYKREAIDARRTRMKQNLENRRAFLGIQDWSHKQRGQSTEFLPKVPVATEQFVAFVKRALTQFGEYYDVVLGRNSKSPLSGAQIRSLMNCFLDNMLVQDNVMSSLPILIADAVKVGSLESLMILKVHGNTVNERKFTLEQGKEIISPEGEETPPDIELKSIDVPNWKLRIDLIPPNDYLKDPSGAGLYEIHSTERDLHYLMKRAEEGVYDKAAVARVTQDFRRKLDEQQRSAIDQGQDESSPPSFRKKVRIDECWGSLIDADGAIVHENVFWTVANDTFLIREPTPNPNWHQESPFIAVPLLRVPFSVWHKALFDHATQINFALNEMYNLIIDGGIASVWGIKQLRLSDLEDPSQVSNGVAQGDTLIVKNTLPHGMKVMETASEGAVPTDAMSVMEMLSREFAAAALSNEVKMGALPPKQVRATEVIELAQSQAVTMDSIVSDVEREFIQKTLKKVWLTILQNMDDVASDHVIDAIGIRGAFALSRMSSAERFAVFADGCSFQVHGLSAVLARVRDFQKIMALLQAVVANPMLLQAFFKKYSPQRVLSHLMKTLGVNPEQMERDEEELGRVGEELQEMGAFAQIAGGGQGGGQGGGAGLAAQDVGEPGLPAEINAVGNPTSGLAGAGGA